jgi:hypothetical protein
LSDL